MSTLKITEAEIRNVCRIQYVHITPNKTMTVIGGENEQGKSTLINCIAWALGGKKLCPKKPIRDGEEFGEISMSLSGCPELPPCKVTRRFFRTSDGYESILEVVDEAGDKAAEPQRTLNKLLRMSSFDPVAYMRKDPQEQVEILRDLVGIDTTALDKEYKKKFDERTVVNRDVRNLDGEIAGMKFHEDVPDDVPAIDDLIELSRQQRQQREEWQKQEDLVAECKRLLEEITEQRRVKAEDDLQPEFRKQDEALASRHEMELRELQERHEKERAELKQEQTDTIAARKQEIDTLDERIQAGVSKTEEEKRKLAELPNPNLEETDAKIKEHSANKEKMAENKRWKEVVAKITAKKTAAKSLTDRLNEIKATKGKMLAEAEWPVEGLGFDETGVTYNDLPLEQAAQSDVLKITVAICAALNPTLKIALVKEGPFLDDHRLSLLAEIADEHDLQVFLERVGDGNECHIIMHDGRAGRGKANGEATVVEEETEKDTG